MIQSARNWFKRNRTNFAIGAGVLGAGYVATQYVLGKVTETRQRMSDERIAKENLRRRFEQNQEDCTFTVLAILPTATENIVEALPVEQALAELQRDKVERLARSVGPSEVSTADLPSAPASIADGDTASLQSSSYVHASQLADTTVVNGEPMLQPTSPGRAKRNKVQLWNEIKLQSIARAFTLIYTLSLLTLLTRIQLNLLGRRNYLASVVSLASPPKRDSERKITLQNNDDDGLENAYGNDFETNRKYLSFSWWLLHRGYRDIMDKVQAAVKEIFGSISPREDVSLQRLSELVVLIRKKIEGFTEDERKNTKWLPFLLPPQDQEDYLLRASGMLSASESTTTTPFLRRLLDETSDLIDSPAFSHVLTLLLDSGFSMLIDHKIAAQAYKIPPVSQSSSRVQELVAPGEAKTKLANTLAVFCRQAHAIGSGATNEYLTIMEQVRDLEAFAAVVYSSNFEFEAPDASSVPLSSVAVAPENHLNNSGESRPGTATTATTLATTPAMITPAVRPAGKDESDGDVPPAQEASLVDGFPEFKDDPPASAAPVARTETAAETIQETSDADLEKAWGKASAKEGGQVSAKESEEASTKKKSPDSAKEDRVATAAN